MKKRLKRLAAAALTACMTMGLMATGVGAVQWRCDQEIIGNKIQTMHIDHEDFTFTNLEALVREVPVGTRVEFTEPVPVCSFDEADNGFAILTPVGEKTASFVIPDTDNIYVFGDGEVGYLVVCGSNGEAQPLTIVGDLSNHNMAVKLSKPVVDIRREKLTMKPRTEAEKSGYVFVYDVPVGTEVTQLFGQNVVSVEYIWDENKNQVEWSEFNDVVAEQFPGSEIGWMTGGPCVPFTLNKVGYYYWLSGDSVYREGEFPVIRVVDDPGTTGTPRVAEFSDMNWSKSYVEKAYGYGWMEGMGDTFDPEGNLTVAQAVTLAARLHATQKNQMIRGADGPWYQRYVEYCLENGVLENYYDNYGGKTHEELLAKMDTKISRMDMIRILSGAVRVRGLARNQEETVTIPDVSKDREGAEFVYNWYREGVVGGKDAAGNFMPDDPIKRGEVAVILCNLLGL